MFKFPDDNFLSKHSSESGEEAVKPQSNENEIMPINNNDVINSMHNDAVTNKAEDSSFSEDICSFLRKNECYHRNGVVYTSEKASAKQLTNSYLICCILPLSVIDNNRIVFPDSPEIQLHRYSRSIKEESANPSLKQRDFILRQKFRPQSTSTKPTGQTEVVTFENDDYIDPYLNIKGSSMNKKNTASSSKQDCNYSDYVEDYTVELPTPGLVGLYSDNGNRPWSFANDNNNNRPSYGGTIDEIDEDDEQSFGYSTIDPRRGPGPSKSQIRGRPQKITTTIPDDVTYNVESQTVSFQSSPNFQVLQGFKLLNLGRTKNKFYSKTTRRSMTDGSFEDDSKEQEGVSHSDLSQGNLKEQVYENCGKTRKLAEDENSDKQFGNAENGSHPWIALVVLTRRPQGILCYATIVHPRAAITTGDCIYGRTATKEVTLIAGLWNLSDRSRIQNRVVTTQLHPQYRAKVLAHDLALLHWKTPLRLNANIQPACLGSAREAEDCKFFGWGGFDQGIRPRSRWQRADILSAQECTARLSKTITMPSDAFCATVQSRGTVTGIGGPLICNANGRKTTAGVAVWRDNALLLLPAQEWIIRAFHDLNIE